MNTKKGYIAPEFDVIRFDGADIITVSGDTAGHGTTASSTDDTRLPAVR